MKALIWSDLHGHNYKEFSTIENGINSRLKNCVDVIEKIQQSAIENSVDEIWFTGDLYQLKNNLDNRVIQLIMHRMMDLAAKFPLLLVPGHHDLYMWSTNPIMMEILAGFSHRIKLCDKLEWINPKNAAVQIYVEPCTRKVKELEERIEKLEPRENAIFLAHQDVIGARYGGFVVERGLDADVLSKKFKWSFIGHNHNPSEYRHNVISVGASLQRDFGDCGEKRGWWILDTEKEEVKFIENIFSPEFVDYTWDPNAEEKDFIPGDWEKDFYRIKVVGHAELPPRLARIGWKRVSYEIKGQVKKRTSISFSDKKENIIEKYVELRGGNLDHKRLIEMGRKYI